jgi:hypothetical protein
MLDYETESSDRPTASVAQFGATWHAAARALQANGHTLEMCIDLSPDVNPSCVNLTKVTYGTLWTYTNFIPFSNGFTDMVCCFISPALLSSLPCLLMQTLLSLLSDRGALQGTRSFVSPVLGCCEFMFNDVSEVNMPSPLCVFVALLAQLCVQRCE